MAQLRLSAPWVLYYRELEKMFEKDSEVRVIYDDENKQIKLFVHNSLKADALTQLLPFEKSFGNVTLNVQVVPANTYETKHMTNAELYKNAFDKNPVLSYVQTIQGVFTNNITYVVFANEVAQYWSDDLSDVNGNTSTLYQEIAKDLFVKKEGVFFWTDVKTDSGSMGKPLGEWP